MANQYEVSDEDLRAALTAEMSHATKTEAARSLNLERSTYVGRLRLAKRRGLTPRAATGDDVASLKYRLKTVEAELSQARDNQLTAHLVRREIIGLRDSALAQTPPKWTQEIKKGGKGKSLVPMSIWSDWHWGEVVEKAQVNGVNEYNLEVAHARADQLLDSTINLCLNYTVHGEYPGFVLMLGGDMVSGTIHDELSMSNEKPIMPIVVDLFGVLLRGIEALREHFGKVYVVGVVGNHGRTSVRPHFKNHFFENYDWLIYNLLAKHFENDPAVTFNIPESSDAYFNVWAHRFLLTHGDRLGVAGGDGIIGALGPIMRGSFKTRNSSASIGLDFDTLVMGHWHQYIPLPRVIVNGALKGYDQFAKDKLRCVPERAQQALWFVHPTNGIISQQAVYCDEIGVALDHSWVSWVER